MFEPLHWKRSQYFKQVFKFLIQLFHTHTFQSHWRRMTAWFSWFQSHCGSWQPDLRFIEMLYEMFISIHAIHSTNPWFQSHCGSRSTWNNWIHLMMELTLLCGIQHGSFFYLYLCYQFETMNHSHCYGIWWFAVSMFISIKHTFETIEYWIESFYGGFNAVL